MGAVLGAALTLAFFFVGLAVAGKVPQIANTPNMATIEVIVLELIMRFPFQSMFGLDNRSGIVIWGDLNVSKFLICYSALKLHFSLNPCDYHTDENQMFKLFKTTL